MWGTKPKDSSERCWKGLQVGLCRSCPPPLSCIPWPVCLICLATDSGKGIPHSTGLGTRCSWNLSFGEVTSFLTQGPLCPILFPGSSPVLIRLKVCFLAEPVGTNGSSEACIYPTLSSQCGRVPSFSRLFREGG